eukprot:TRINITY_DN16127_c0_g1_i1.p1 TRINITY_DN16127_c0_g1~~TRINITY_DN16127_c0_g1_i1.p1  ORF type:complete len:234 (-),score=1.16 TRINITY_DN16127_c0_g1_i1:354-1055(-)
MAPKVHTIVCTVLLIVLAILILRSSSVTTPLENNEVVYISTFPPPPPPEGNVQQASYATSSSVVSTLSALTAYDQVTVDTGLKLLAVDQAITNQGCPSVRQNHTASVRQCRDACKEVGCNAVNVNILRTTCVFRTCKSVSDSVLEDYPGWAAFSVMPEFKQVGQNQAFSSKCPSIGSARTWTLEDCIKQCEDKAGCTGVNILIPRVNCIQRVCKDPAQAVLGANRYWKAYLLE